MEKPTKKAKDVQAQSADRVDATAAKTAGMDTYMLKVPISSKFLFSHLILRFMQ